MKGSALNQTKQPDTYLRELSVLESSLPCSDEVERSLILQSLESIIDNARSALDTTQFKSLLREVLHLFPNLSDSYPRIATELSSSYS